MKAAALAAVCAALLAQGTPANAAGRGDGIGELPAIVVTARKREERSEDVPISIIAKDPSVFRQIAPWHWQDGLLPGPGAPLKPMDAFRNQFLGAFDTASSRAASAPGSR